jgi:pimeloyl-ACP methyl ester carboxylesterase
MEQKPLFPKFRWFCLWCCLLLLAPTRFARADGHAVLVTEGTAAVSDVELGYRMAGEGPPLLLITGYGCTMDNWDPLLVAALAARHRVILFDNRGMGASTASKAPFSLDLFAEDAAGLLAALGIEKAGVLGWSMGAVTALELALNHPEMVDKVVAYGGAAEPGPVNAAVEEFSRMTPTQFSAQLFPKTWAEAHPEVLARLPRPATKPDPAIVGRQRQALAEWPGFGDRLAGLTRPVLLVVGLEDAVTPPGQSLRLAQSIPGAWLIRFAGAGHWLQYQAPQDLARVVDTFLTVPEDLTVAPAP